MLKKTDDDFSLLRSPLNPKPAVLQLHRHESSVFDNEFTLMATVDLSELLSGVVRCSFTWRMQSGCLSPAVPPDRKPPSPSARTSSSFNVSEEFQRETFIHQHQKCFCLPGFHKLCIDVCSTFLFCSNGDQNLLNKYHVAFKITWNQWLRPQSRQQSVFCARKEVGSYFHTYNLNSDDAPPAGHWAEYRFKVLNWLSYQIWKLLVIFCGNVHLWVL